MFVGICVQDQDIDKVYHLDQRILKTGTGLIASRSVTGTSIIVERIG